MFPVTTSRTLAMRRRWLQINRLALDLTRLCPTSSIVCSQCRRGTEPAVRADRLTFSRPANQRERFS